MCKKSETSNNSKPMAYDALLGTVDYSKITLCPVYNYETYCCVCGNCEYCPNYKTNKGEDCDGCGANYKHKPNPKARFNCA